MLPELHLPSTQFLLGRQISQKFIQALMATTDPQWNQGTADDRQCPVSIRKWHSELAPEMSVRSYFN